MNNVILLRYGELHLKGKNKGYFERVLLSNIKKIVSHFNAKVEKISGRYIVFGYDAIDEDILIEKLTKVFGLVSLSPAKELDTDKQAIEDYINSLTFLHNTFRVSVKRADKTFPIPSNEFEKHLGGIVLKNNTNIKVSLKNFELEIVVDIRENKKTYITTTIIPCVGGMPYSTAGNGLLLLSGGIDSPVAGYMMAKRGLKLFALHFHSFPYTSLQAKQKVIKLATLLKEYCGDITLICCPFTKIQEEIHKNCDSDFMITIMRRIMMKIASKVCDMYSCGAIITGENLGQVASQTMESMTVTNFSQTKHPIFRPLIAFDKQDIIEVATKINTYETSILPYEDCCTVFLPKTPVIKPKIEKVLKQEQYLDIETLIEEALNNLEIIEC